MNEQTTWSPALTRVTSGPTASITPAPSCPPTIGSRPVESPVCRCSSEWHIPEAMNLIRTSPALGSSSSSSVTSHGLPGSLMIAALVRIPSVLLPGPGRGKRPPPLRLSPPPVVCGQSVAAARARGHTLKLMAVKTPETRTALVRRARKINRVLAETYPDAHCRTGLQEPVPAPRRHGAVRADDGQAGQPDHAAAVRQVPGARGPGGGQPRGRGRDPPADRVLQREDQVRDGTVRRARRALRRRGAAHPRGDGHAARRRAARPPTWSSATPTASLASRWTRTSAGCPGGSAGPRATTRSRSRRKLASSYPRRDWVLLSHRLIWHGRRICHARKPACGACPVADWCPSFGLGPTDAATAAKLVKDGPFS